MFHGTAAASGLVLPIYSNTAQLFGLWNPSDSGVDAVLASVELGYVSTTAAAGGYVMGLLTGVGSSVATAAPISAFTAGAPLNGRMGSKTGGNSVRFSPSAVTVTTGLMVIGFELGLNQLVVTASDATTVPWRMGREFDGEYRLAPGNAWFVCGNIATLATWVPTISWAEERIVF